MNKRIDELRKFLNTAAKLEASATIQKEDVPILSEILNKYVMFHYTAFFPEHEEMFEAIEAALGFDLFTWQKTFIAIGTYRKTGKTTAEVLEALLNNQNEPLDFSQRAKNMKEDIFRSDLRKVQLKLQEAGIPTRIVFWNKWDKKRYEQEQRINKHIEEETKAISKPLWRV